MSKSKILFLMSGSIAAFKACALISKLVQLGHDVQVAATDSTFKFIGPATIEGLTGKAALSDLWEHGRAMEHIHLTRWADFALLCPASANTIAKIANGFGDDLVSALTLAWPKSKPYFVYPAMNHEMLQNGAVQENLERLRRRGFRVEQPNAGPLACGEVGAGRLPEPDEILAKIFGPTRGRILITAGATREPIDGIRFISNVSTGRTSATLADELMTKGWDVTFVHGEGSAHPRQNPARAITFSSFADLDEKLHNELSQNSYTGVVHAAAVGDYGLDQAPIDRKLPSGESLMLNLKPNFKILPRLKDYSQSKGLKVVGFKLTLNAAETERRAAALKAMTVNVDAVVSNDWSEVAENSHPTVLYTRAGQELKAHTLDQLSESLNQFFIGELK